ncbi:PIN-like domain-containing protein [Stenotrophomonas rhizophila]
MRQEFSGYFDPSAEDVQALWKDAVIALDTNVLLSLYRMPASARDALFELLKLVGARLWVPYHVMVEYHRNRLEVMRAEYKAAQQVERDFKAAYVALKGVAANKGVKERACWPAISKKLDQLNKEMDELLGIAKSESDSYISPNSQDLVLEFLEQLLPGRCGARPASQKVVDIAQEEAESRYAVKMGPGYLDSEKAGDRYMFDGLVYDRQYGDFMVWRELLEHCRGTKVRRLLLITSDVKDDWWLDSQSISGKRPQPELVMEMRRLGGVENFWMYTLSEFVTKAAIHLKTNLTQQAITEVRQVESNASRAAKTLISRERLRAVTQAELSRVLIDMGARYMDAGSGYSSGYEAHSDGRYSAVLVISGEVIISGYASIRRLIDTAVPRLGLVHEISQLEIYVAFGMEPNSKWIDFASSSVMDTVRSLKSGIAQVNVHVVYFANQERTMLAFASSKGEGF